MSAFPGLYVPLDVTYAEDPKIMAAGEAAEVLFLRGLAKAKALRSDGELLDGHIERLGLSDPHIRAERLVAVGLWERIPCGYRITSWAKWNPDADALDREREAHRDGAAKTNHQRWHVGRNITVPDCSFCSPADRSSDRYSDNSDKAADGRSLVAPLSLATPDREDESPGGMTSESLQRSLREDKRSKSTPTAPPSAGAEVNPAGGDRTVEAPPDPSPPSASRPERPDQETLEADFDMAWALYPRKGERKGALQAYRATRHRGADRETLLTATRNYAAAVDAAGTEERYIKLGKTFFGPKEPWGDHLEAPAPAPDMSHLSLSDRRVAI